MVTIYLNISMLYSYSLSTVNIIFVFIFILGNTLQGRRMAIKGDPA